MSQLISRLNQLDWRGQGRNYLLLAIGAIIAAFNFHLFIPHTSSFILIFTHPS